jgi:hypothetical protein
MAITIRSALDNKGVDALRYTVHGLPWLMWDEDRPSGSKKRVACAIYGSDELMFKTSGSMLSDPVYRERPWEKLIGFRAVPARDLYYSGMEKRIEEELKRNGVLFRLLLPDDAVVMTAEFADDRPSLPMHLNYGVGTPVEVAELHDALYQRFIGERKAIVDAVCGGEFKYPSPVEAQTEARAKSLTEAVNNSNRKNSFWGRLFGR